MSTCLHIKNMVCHRCVLAVEEICRDLLHEGYEVELGKVCFYEPLSQEVMSELCQRLKGIGFEPITGRDDVRLEKLRNAVRHYARNRELSGSTLSSFIRETLNEDYRTASRLFSALEGRTLQSYLMAQRVEYVVEMLFDGELSLAEIADRAGFSTVAHLSRTFKKQQGVTISEFRVSGKRREIDKL